MSKKNRPSFLMLCVHVLLTLSTSGLWFIGLVIWHIMQSNKK